MNAIEVNRLNTFYGKSHILHDVSMVAEEGSITTLLGRNGAGKATMMRSIMGLTPARSGSIKVFDHDAEKLAPYQVARLRVGYMPERRHVFANLSVENNLKVPQGVSGPIAALAADDALVQSLAGASAEQWDLDKPGLIPS